VKTARYAELRCKTNYSFLKGASRPEELIVRAHELGLHSLALADENGVYGIPKAYWKAKDFPGFKLIVGAEVVLENHSPLTFLCRDRAAYAVLCRLITAAHAGKEKGKAMLLRSELESFAQYPGAQGLVILPYLDGDFGWLKQHFSSLYVPLSRNLDGLDEQRTAQAKEIAESYSLEIVATNDVLYHVAERKNLQDSVTCIREGTTLIQAGYKLSQNSERHLKSPEEMELLFHDLPEAIARTVEIAESCIFSMSELRYLYPSEWIPTSHTAQSYLEEITWQGAEERYPLKKYPGGIPEKVLKQVKHELKLIEQLKFADYFLTIYDIVAFARRRDILCQGRGSAANSAVCYCLGVTAIDPVQMDLLFERFISVERNEPPDIDVDFEHERREEVIQYIYQKYGRDRAAMVSAVVTYHGRSAFREISKVLGVDVGTLSSKEVLKKFETLAQTEEAKRIPDLRKKIEQLTEEMDRFPRHLSIHSGGFTLSAHPIIETVPVEPARMEGRTIVQWDKYDLDYLGLLKIDVLSLGMLTALKRILDLVKLKLHEIPHDHQATYEMIQRADTVGTFQVESRAQMNMSGRLMPTNFYDLVVQVAIVRPGPIQGNMVHPYLKRKHGLEKVIYPHPKLEEILGRTLGVPLFQEQLMKIAIDLGDFSGGEADVLRRAIGAWRADGPIESIGNKLIDRLRAKGIPEEYINLIFEQMRGFAHYGFPESHAASFAHLAYASCYLKHEYPAEFACSAINSQPMGFYANHTLIDDARLHGVKIYPIDPQLSSAECTIECDEIGKRGVRLGLNLIRGLTAKEVESVIRNRPYFSMTDFLSRNSFKMEVLEKMAMAGMFQNMGDDPRTTLWRILSYQLKGKRSESADQGDLFAQENLDGDETVFKALSDFEQVTHDYAAAESSSREHMMAALRREKRLPPNKVATVKELKHGTWTTISGLTLVRQRPPTAGGVCFGALEDETGILDFTLFEKEYEKFKEVFLSNSFITISGVLQRDRNSVNLLVKKLSAVFEQASENRELGIKPDQYFW